MRRKIGDSVPAMRCQVSQSEKEVKQAQSRVDTAENRLALRERELAKKEQELAQREKDVKQGICDNANTRLKDLTDFCSRVKTQNGESVLKKFEEENQEVNFTRGRSVRW